MIVNDAMTNLDCKDIKAMLSGLVDDEVDPGTRHAAERHLADCRGCRDLLNEAESVHQMIALDAQRSLWPVGLPSGFQDAVLGKTVYAEAYNLAGRRWTSWLGWVAAAACLMLALSIWSMNQQTIGPSIGPIVASNDRSTAKLAQHTKSWTYDGPVPGLLDAQTARDIDTQLALYDPSPAGLERGGGSMISRDDAEALFAASNLLAMLAQADLGSFAAVEKIRQIAEYDDLPNRLAEARQRLTAEDRLVVLAAESVLLRIINGPINLDDLKLLRDSAGSMELSAHVQAISDQWPNAASL